MKKSNIEMEVKFYLSDLGVFESRLRKLGAVQVTPRTSELNLRFDLPDMSLTNHFQVLRLRRDQKNTLAFKGPNEAGSEARIRQEIEVIVNDFGNAILLLENLGYEEIFRYEKWRTTYHLNDLEITLDETPIGNFTEIEGEDVDNMRSTAGGLGLDWGARISEGYLGLFQKIKQNPTYKMTNLTFEDFKGISVSSAELGVKPADLPIFY